MKLVEFEALCPNCIVCGKKMKRVINKAITGRDVRTSHTKAVLDKKYYNVNMICARAEKCFGYLSNAVSIHDSIEVSRFYMSFPKVQVFSIVGEYTQIMANGQVNKITYVPFESWINAKGQILEKIEKLLLLLDSGTK